MNERVVEAASGRSQRVFGAVYLAYFVLAIAGGVLQRGLVVASDAAATATNLLAHESLYRSGYALGLLGNISYIVLAVLFYRMFRTVNRSVALLAAFFGLAGCTIQMLAGLLQMAPLTVLGDHQVLGEFSTQQAQVVALLLLRLYAQAFYIGFVCFAMFDVMIGYLIYRSTFAPRWLGLAWIFAGIGWITFVWPSLALSLRWFIVPVGGLAEIAFMVWLFVSGGRQAQPSAGDVR